MSEVAQSIKDEYFKRIDEDDLRHLMNLWPSQAETAFYFKVPPDILNAFIKEIEPDVENFFEFRSRYAVHAKFKLISDALKVSDPVRAGDNYSASMHQFALKNLAKWSDKVDVDVTHIEAPKVAYVPKSQREKK